MKGRAGKKRRQRGTSTMRGVAVAGGFKAGKRRKGNSLLKRSPVTVLRVGDIRREAILSAIEKDSQAVAYLGANDGVRMLEYTPKP